MDMDHRLSHELCFSFYTVNRLFNQLYHQALAPFKLTYTQYLVLILLWEQDHQTLKEISAQLDLASNTLTPLLKRLSEKGLITRRHPENNQRQVLITLTKQGRDLQQPIETALTDCFATIAGLDAKTATTMLTNNQHLIEQLEHRELEK